MGVTNHLLAGMILQVQNDNLLQQAMESGHKPACLEIMNPTSSHCFPMIMGGRVVPGGMRIECNCD